MSATPFWWTPSFPRRFAWCYILSCCFIPVAFSLKKAFTQKLAHFGGQIFLLLCNICFEGSFLFILFFCSFFFRMLYWKDSILFQLIPNIWIIRKLSTTFLYPIRGHHLTNFNNYSFSNSLGPVRYHLRKQVVSKLQNDQFWLQGLFSLISHSHANW